MDAKTVHGLLNAVPWCGCIQGSHCSLRDDPGEHGNGEMGQMQQGLAGMGSRQRQADKAWQGKAVVAKTGRQVKLAGTGLVAKTGLQVKLAGTGLAVKTGRQVKLTGTGLVAKTGRQMN